MKIARTLKALFPILLFLYPVLIFLGVKHYDPGMASLVLCFVLVARIFVFRNSPTSPQGKFFDIVLWLVLLTNVVNLFFHSELALKIYPVLMSAGTACAFWLSLWRKPPLIERFARMREVSLSPARVRYTWQLTVIWAVWLSLNTLISLYTAFFTSLETWTLYNSLLFYIFSGVLLGVDLGYRRFVLTKAELRA